MAGRRTLTTRLRSLREADIEPLSAWLPPAASEAGCERWAAADALRETVGRPDTLVSGKPGIESFVSYELAAPQRDAAQIVFLAVTPDRRRLGVGQRTVLALERRLTRSAARCFVLVPARLGLALYFWLRLGYRPLTQAASPAQREAGLWLVRQLD